MPISAIKVINTPPLTPPPGENSLPKAARQHAPELGNPNARTFVSCSFEMVPTCINLIQR